MKSMGSFWVRFALGGPKYDSCQLHVLQTRTPAAMKSMGSFWLRFASGGPKYDSCQLHVLQTKTPAAMKSMAHFGCALRWEDQSMTVASCMCCRLGHQRQ